MITTSDRHLSPAARTGVDPGYPAGDAFNAFGHPVSTERQCAALDVLVEEIGVRPLAADTSVREAALFIAEDNPEAALRSLMVVVDLTGAYRVIATLCTG